MRRPGVQDAYRMAWRHAHRLPAPVGYALAHGVGDIIWCLHRLRGALGGAGTGSGVGQLERNLSRVLPGASPAQVRAASRSGMRSYMRYFYEVFALPGIGPQQLQARVRADADPALHEDLRRGGVVLALGHTGNWDLAAAWACRELAPVLTVAERLEPADLFEQFTAFRQGLGMRIIGQARGERVFDRLVSAAREEHCAIALLADRDLSSAGIEARLCGHSAYVAAGPAAIAAHLDLPLYVASIHYERLTGQRRRRAGSPWGLVLTIRAVPGVQDGPDRVAEHTRAWVRELGPLLAAHPQDWHMLQPVFTEDLDPQRLARGWARDSRQESHTSAESAMVNDEPGQEGA